MGYAYDMIKTTSTLIFKGLQDFGGSFAVKGFGRCGLGLRVWVGVGARGYGILGLWVEG